jgi:hypothetical protein
MSARLERYLFPPNNLPTFIIILSLSLLLSFLLLGKQVLYANWGLIDDHETYFWLGPGLHLPITDVWHTLITKTEIGTFQGRFRPTYCLLRILETAIWGTNVHLWYLARTVGFGIFIASIWWTINRFVGVWLGAILLIPFLTASFWPDVWARLGPSEIYGAVALGMILFGANCIFGSESRGQRLFGAAVIAVATIILVGAKETFVPLAGLSIVLLLLAGALRLLPMTLVAGLIILISGFAGFIIYVVQRIVINTGTDYYANSFKLPQLMKIAGDAFVHAIAYWLPLYLAAILWFAITRRRSGKPLRDWTIASSAVLAIFAFLVAVYVSQSVIYRSEIALGMRYDFPKALYTAFNSLLLVCYVAYLNRLYLAPATVNWLTIGFSILLCSVWAPKLAHGLNRPLSDGVEHNIQRTNDFFHELESIVSVARASPQSPIILEAYEPWSWSSEPVLSLSRYLTALGVRNPVSLRMHSGDHSSGALDDALERSMTVLQDRGDESFVPLAENVANMSKGCISIGINGPPVPACTGFAVKTE